jgi:hypothetical protein
MSRFRPAPEYARSDEVRQHPAGPNHHSNTGAAMAKCNNTTGTVYVPHNGVYAAPMAYRLSGDALVLVGLLGVAGVLLGAFVGLVS